ncbi:hypothetical protein C6496_05995 [Candidatus Poribacteria bacterium]|nr:MAG: hypothetical protein C6496_05995 [Candidatus Poribacteria bacterium]
MRQLLSYAVFLLVFGIVSYATANLTDDLVIYFTFDNIDGKRILDDSGNGLDAEVVENTKFVEGKYGNAVRITRRTEDCVNVPTADKLEIDGEITMMAWVYHEDWTGRTFQWFDKGSYSAEIKHGYGMAVFDTEAHGFGIGVIVGGAFRTHLIILHNLENKTWHHIVGICEDTRVKIYLNGENLIEHEVGFNFIGTNEEDLRIGCAKGKPEYTFENGSMDEVAIWSRVLSEDEIKTAMQGPLFDVTPKDKVATTWGDIKREVLQP